GFVVVRTKPRWPPARAASGAARSEVAPAGCTATPETRRADRPTRKPDRDLIVSAYPEPAGSNGAEVVGVAGRQTRPLAHRPPAPALVVPRLTVRPAPGGGW